MIHRALLGSFERFIGILIEHYAGELPLWLAPVQAIVLPVSDRFNDYAATVRERAARRRRARRARRSQRVGRAQDPRGRAAQDPLHARRRRARAGRRDGLGARAPGTSGAAVESRSSGLRSGALRDPQRACAGSALYSTRVEAPQITQSATPSSRLTRGHRQLVPVPRRFDRRPPERDTDEDQRAHPRSRGPADRRRGQPDRRA